MFFEQHYARKSASLQKSLLVSFFYQLLPEVVEF